MAQMTPNEILAISEPIEAIYQRTIDELLINIARHFEISGWERTRYWEIKKLSEMGALTKESAAIIAKNTQMVPAEIEKAFIEVSQKACLDIDPQLREAAAKGILQNPNTTPQTSVMMRTMVQAYVDQAVDTANMVNTTMLESTRQVYLKGVTTAVNEAMLQEAKETLEAGALSVVTGVETRSRAIRKAMNVMASTGITGFYDKAGRSWSADAYVAMVIRTTAHNTAIQSIKTRQQEFGGGDVFQVSTHAGARPLCFPYQGKFFSWSSEGVFTDGAGHKHEYRNIEDSSYGEPAGLFGINCGHHPIPMIEGFSYPQEGPTETEAENDKEYEESQRQRQYERDIRAAKRDLEMAKASGDEAAIKQAEQKVAQKQANMRAFTKETGRPRRYDREAIGGQALPEGYRGYRQELNSDIPFDKAQQNKTVKRSAELQNMVDGLQKNGVKYNEVKRRASALSETEIINTIGGGDQTSGSCVSVALAYAGQKDNLDVLDFRGGKSLDWFAGTFGWLLKGGNALKEMQVVTESAKSQITAGKKLLKHVEEGNEYFYCAGYHAAIVRKSNGVLQYLELQSPTNNGWKDFDGNLGFTLSTRFGAVNGKASEAAMFNVNDIKGSDEFRELLGYINTPASDQKKGKHGKPK